MMIPTSPLPSVYHVYTFHNEFGVHTSHVEGTYGSIKFLIFQRFLPVKFYSHPVQVNFKIWTQYPVKHVMIRISPLVTSTSISSNIFSNFAILTSDIDSSTNFLNMCPMDNLPQNFESKSKYFSLLIMFYSPEFFILMPGNSIQKVDGIIP